MPRPARFLRRLPDSIRSRLEVASALAWEALVETHVAHAFQFIGLMDDYSPLEDALSRYLLEMDIAESMAQAIRTRVLVGIDDDPIEPTPEPGEPAADEDQDGWRRFRPDVVMKGVRERQRRQDEADTLVELALARAEEAVITTHVDNAITFAALLDEHLPLAGAVQQYLGAVDLAGGRAQAVFQRTMARLAEVHLPPSPRRPPARPATN
jgi:hypothetical protein